MKKRTLAALVPAALAGIALQDLVQKEHALRRNFPVIARARYLLESIGPELRQYIITSNDDGRPFSRDQRRWVYTSAKKNNNYFAFGTDNDTENASYPIIKQATFSEVVPRLADPRARHRAAGRKDTGRTTGGTSARLPAVVGGQCVGDVVRFAQPAGDPGDQQGSEARRLLAQHGRGWLVGPSPPGRRPGVPDRHRLLRLPQRARRVRSRPADRRRRVRPGPRRRVQAQPGRETRSGRPPSGCQGERRDRPDPGGCPGGQGRRQPVPAHRIPQCRRDARRRRAGRRRHGTAGRNQVRGGRDRILAGAGRPNG